MAKRYFWLRLHDDFFDSKRIKKLRKMAGGDTYLIIYLKMQLLAMKTDGVLRFTGLEDDFAEELALDIDEETDNVKMTLSYLLHVGLAETSDNVNFFFPYAVENTGSEGSSAKRMRDCRKRQKLSQSDTDVTPLLHFGDGEIEKEKEKEIKKELELDVDVDSTDCDTDTNKLNAWGGELGQGVLMLTEAQEESLLEQLTLDEFNTYTRKLSDYILSHPGYTIKSHYDTILKWVKEDRMRGV